MNGKTHFTASVFVFLAATAAASGQAQLVQAHEETEANAWVWEWNGAVKQNHGFDSSNIGIDYSHTEFRSLTEHGYDGYGTGWRNTMFSPSNPGVGGYFYGFSTDAGAEACQFSSDFGNHQEEGSWGWTDGKLTFSVLVPMAWSWQGWWQGTTLPVGHYFNAHAELHVEDLGGGFYVNEVRDSLNSVGDWNEPISFGGIFYPGTTYTVAWTMLAEIWGWHGAQVPLGCVPTSMTGNFNLSPIPAPGAAALFGLAGISAARRRRA